MRRAVIVIAITAIIFVILTPFPGNYLNHPPTPQESDTYQPVRPVLPPSNKKRPDPIRWLQENSNNKHAASKSVLPALPTLGSHRPRAAIISLVRNSELAGMMQSIRQLEYRWNGKYRVRHLMMVPVLSLMLGVSMDFLQR